MTKNDYRPSDVILERYADVLVNFALGGGKGIRKGDVVQIIAEECAKPLFVQLCKAVWKSGGHVIPSYRPSNDAEYNLERDFFLHTEGHQLDFFPTHSMKGLVRQMDHSIFIDSKIDKHSLSGIDARKIMRRGRSVKPFIEWRDAKENQGRFTWTIGLYGTATMAREANMSLKEYWKEIINACFLDKTDPIAVWKRVYKGLEIYRMKLNRLDAEKLRIEGPDADLWITLGKKRRWMGGSGRNMPSFELFTSPDWRGTEGWIRFDQPLYRYGSLVDGIMLSFKDGKVIKSSARKNQKVLREMIATENADKIGEFSLTDRRFSRITRFMAETLFDENIGGPNGNTHIALGRSYHDCFDGDPAKMTKRQWLDLGYNSSVVHTDIMSTAPRTVTAYRKDGSRKVIYKNGIFTL